MQIRWKRGGAALGLVRTVTQMKTQGPLPRQEFNPTCLPSHSLGISLTKA
jgi:hypothetical protein